MCVVLSVVGLIGTMSGWLSESAHAMPDRGKRCVKCHTQKGSSRSFTDTFYLEQCNGFSDTGSNPYFILEPDYQLVLEGTEKKQTVQLIITVLGETKTVTLDIGGVPTGVVTRVVEERESKDEVLVEVSRNYFAICNRTNSVMYFGEAVDIFNEDGTITHEGAWEAGVDGAKPGIIMPGTILLGGKYFQEIAPGVAMDRAEIRSINAVVQVPAAPPPGNFTNCLKTRETTPLEGGVGIKFYAPGVGLVKDDSLHLVQYGFIP